MGIEDRQSITNKDTLFGQAPQTNKIKLLAETLNCNLTSYLQQSKHFKLESFLTLLNKNWKMSFRCWIAVLLVGLFAIVLVKGNEKEILESKTCDYRLEQEVALNGTIVPESNCETARHCGLHCMMKACCKAFLFNSFMAEKCKLILASQAQITRETWSDYQFYKSEINIGAVVVSEWRSSCPLLYFPLDSSTGTALGESPGNIQFIQGGKIGNTLFSPTDSQSGNRAYYKLGNYPSPQYCFPEPTRCNDGVTFSFFLNILGDVAGNNVWQGFFSTVPEQGPGFLVYWHPISGFQFLVRRDEDTHAEHITIPSATFMTDHGFNEWVHYLITYKYSVSMFLANRKLQIESMCSFKVCAGKTCR